MNRLIALATITFGLGIAATAQADTVLITGSNRGLGLEFARQYAARGWTVIATARHPESATDLKSLAAKNKKVTIETLDLLDRAGIKALAAKYQGKPIDVVLNNAAVLGDLNRQALGSFDYANFEEVMAVNVYGPLAVAEAFREHVAASRQKKIVSITSGAGVVSRPRRSGGITFYSVSKAALNMAMVSLAGDLRDRGVIVALIAPGTADTDMRRALVGAQRAAQDQRPADAVAKIIKIIDGLTLDNSDKPLNVDGSVLPW